MDRLSCGRQKNLVMHNQMESLMKNYTMIATCFSGRFTLFLGVLLMATLLSASFAGAAGPAVVDLGTAGNFAALAKTGISATGTTSIVGDIGISPSAASAITGFDLILDSTNTFSTSALVTGKIYAADYTAPTPTNMTTAISDMQTAYTDAAGRTLPDFTELYAGDVTGKTLTPGLYKWGTGVLVSAGGVTISGAADDVWIFQIAQDLTVANGAIVTLSGGAQASNIFWQVAGQVTLGTTSAMKGNILSMTLIEMQTGASLTGRALAQTAVTLDSNAVTKPVPVTPPVVATKLAFGVQPSNFVSGGTITPAVTVRILDAGDILVTGDTRNVTLAIAENPGSGTLSGTTTVAASNGVATFNNLSINMLGTGYSFSATSSPVLTEAISNTFDITAGVLHHFSIGAISTPQNAGSAFSVTITAQDANNNTVTGFSGTVDFSTNAGTISPSTSNAFTNGQLLQDVTVTDGGTGKIITAMKSGGSESGTSNTITINAGHQYQWSTMAKNGGLIDQTTMPELSQYGLDNLSIDIPEGALKQQIRLQVRVPNTIPAEKAAIQAAEFVVENNESGFAFDKPVTIAIPYPDTVTDETGLTMRYWNETDQGWEPIDLPQSIVMNKTTRVVSAQVNHFSIYGVVAAPAAIAAVNLGTAGNFVALAKTGISATGTTSIVGDIGISPSAASAITGFDLILDSTNTFSTSALVTGKIYAADYTAPTPTILTTAVSDMETAYTEAAGRTLPDFTELYAGDVTGKTLTPGLYKWGTGVLVSAGGVTISGAADDVWIFQIAQDLTVANEAIVTLSGGAQAKNIFWQVAGQTTLGTMSAMKGNILCQTLIEIQTGAALDGRALAQTAVTLDGNAVTKPVEDITPVEATKVRVETAADGSGTVVPLQSVAPGNSITVYGITRDASDTFVANVAADSWELINKTGGVVSGDLIQSGDMKSAVFTGNDAGTAEIQVISGILTATNSGTITVSSVTTVENDPMPNEFSLSQNFPNPFNPSTTIQYSLVSAGKVSLKVYNMVGQEVATLVDGYQDEGSYSVTFNADDGTSSLSNGVYFYRLESGSFVSMKKFVFMK